MTAEVEGKFKNWVDRLALRVSAAHLDLDLEKELVARLKDPCRDDQIFSKINAHVHDHLLKADLVRALMVLDGTFAIRSLDDTGRPLEWR